MNDLAQQSDRQFADLCQDIRELRTTSQCQMWTLIVVMLLTFVGGAITFTVFP